ncbi:hypothetical protein DFA_10236 [Cavenderia fasciculata]|uniref:Uncharacterized protein n=1 Tax=Cavenderia fasciculata TaxID=261658 RepID=F4Q9N2_CACFS|nr:uncharacterized protein DFA_10236 [Cavenderia fasciculata]EGG15401.1 hypothetical protein DFA_10236 [Cavenderia fasciculata]|eukprot:XP_004354143.1 hypothetical protein DFA_10236 [Cavenderia fasciculata]
MYTKKIITSNTSTPVSKIQQQQGQRLYQSISSIFQRLSSSPSSFIVGQRYLSTLNVGFPKVETQSTTIVNEQEGKIWIDSIRNNRFDAKLSLFGSPKKRLIEHIEGIAPKGVKLETISNGQTKNGCYVSAKFDPKTTSMQEIMDKIRENAAKYNLYLHCLEAHGQEYSGSTGFLTTFIVTFDGIEIPLSQLHSLLSPYGSIYQMRTKGRFSEYLWSRIGISVTFDEAVSATRATKCLHGLSVSATRDTKCFYGLAQPESKTILKFKSIMNPTTRDIIYLLKDLTVIALLFMGIGITYDYLAYKQSFLKQLSESREFLSQINDSINQIKAVK